MKKIIGLLSVLLASAPALAADLVAPPELKPFYGEYVGVGATGAIYGGGLGEFNFKVDEKGVTAIAAMEGRDKEYVSICQVDENPSSQVPLVLAKDPEAIEVMGQAGGVVFTCEKDKKNGAELFVVANKKDDSLNIFISIEGIGLTPLAMSFTSEKVKAGAMSMAIQGKEITRLNPSKLP